MVATAPGRWPRARAMMAALLLAAGLDPGAAVAGALEDVGEARAVAVSDGDTLIVTPPVQGAERVRLIGLRTPKRPLGRESLAASPFADRARSALEGLAVGRPIRLRTGGRTMDRHGRLLAQAYRSDDGTWLQGALLADGLARVESFADNAALVSEMLHLEAAARRSGKGLWADPRYAPRAADDARRLNGLLGAFHLIEGRVRAAADVRGTVYLNFGRDWRTDFTVRLKPAIRRRFVAAGVDPLTLEGRRIRVRGWLESHNGPMIEATHPEQVELLEPGPPHR